MQQQIRVMDHVLLTIRNDLYAPGGSHLILFFDKVSVMKPALMIGWLMVIEV